MSSLFTKIITGEINCYKIFEDERCIAFLDIYPISYGHILVVPKQEIDCWNQLSLPEYLHIQKISYQLSHVLQDVTKCERVGQFIDGREIPHCHIHILPLVSDKKINEKSISKIEKNDFQELQQKFVSYIKINNCIG